MDTEEIGNIHLRDFRERIAVQKKWWNDVKYVSIRWSDTFKVLYMFEDYWVADTGVLDEISIQAVKSPISRLTEWAWHIGRFCDSTWSKW